MACGVPSFAYLIEHWPASVGATFAELMRLVAFDITGTLHVRATRSIAAHELAPLATELLAVLPEKLDGVPLRRVRFLPPEHAPYIPPTKRNAP